MIVNNQPTNQPTDFNLILIFKLLPLQHQPLQPLLTPKNYET